MESKYALQIHDLLAGTVGGCLGIIIGTPLDFVKVRLQSPNYNYSGPIHAARTILKNEGAGSFFKGLLPPLMSNVPINAISFATYADCYRSLTKYSPPPALEAPRPSHSEIVELTKQLQRDISPLITPQYVEQHSVYSTVAENISFTAKFLAGCFSGWLQCFVATPSEFLKVQEQNIEGAMNKGSIGIARDFIRQYGLRSLFRGYIATNIRDVPAVGVYFLVFEYVKWMLRTNTYTMDITSSPSPSPTTSPPHLSVKWVHQHEFSYSTLLIAGGCAGIATWVSTYPMDVIKTYIQTVPQDRCKQDATIMKAYRHIIQHKGWRFLFTGMSAAIVRAIPVNAVTFLAYEKMLESFRQHRFLMPKTGAASSHNI